LGEGPQIGMKFPDSSRSLGVAAFGLALLQAVCPAFVALGAVRVAVGLGALALAAGTRAAIRGYHQDLVRIPMMILALVGATLNLFVIWQLRRLRARPAAQWRVSPVSPQQLRSERLQIILALLTYAFLITESLTHLKLHHHL
jgi:MFS family permease